MTTKCCSKCGVEKPQTEFHKDLKNKKHGLKSSCKTCVIAFYLNNAESRLHKQAMARQWNRENRDKVYARNKLWKQNNPDKIADKDKRWKQNNSDKVNALSAKRRAIKLQATPPWLTKEDFNSIQQFYTIANQLTELNNRVHHVDHIIPLLNKDVCGLHVPWNLQVLTGSENMAKSNKVTLSPEMSWDFI